MLADAIDPLMDNEPVDVRKIFSLDLSQQVASFKSLLALVKCGTCNSRPLTAYEVKTIVISAGMRLGSDLPNFYELVYAPATKISETQIAVTQ